MNTARIWKKLAFRVFLYFPHFLFFFASWVGNVPNMFEEEGNKLIRLVYFYFFSKMFWSTPRHFLCVFLSNNRVSVLKCAGFVCWSICIPPNFCFFFENQDPVGWTLSSCDANQKCEINEFYVAPPYTRETEYPPYKIGKMIFLVTKRFWTRAGLSQTTNKIIFSENISQNSNYTMSTLYTPCSWVYQLRFMYKISCNTLFFSVLKKIGVFQIFSLKLFLDHFCQYLCFLKDSNSLLL
jgi:hypothetical protein